MNFTSFLNNLLEIISDNWLLLLLTICLTEIFKMFLPDQYEKKWVPVGAIIIALVLGFLNNIKILTGWIGTSLSIGILATGGYALFFDWIEKFSNALHKLLGKSNNE